MAAASSQMDTWIEPDMQTPTSAIKIAVGSTSKEEKETQLNHMIVTLQNCQQQSPEEQHTPQRTSC